MHLLSRIDPLHPKNEITVITIPNTIMNTAAAPIELAPLISYFRSK